MFISLTVFAVNSIIRTCTLDGGIISSLGFIQASEVPIVLGTLAGILGVIFQIARLYFLGKDNNFRL